MSSLTAAQSAKVEERIAYCSYRGAFQSESPEQFTERMTNASSEFKRAAEFYRNDGDDGRAAHCESMSEFAKFWISMDVGEKTKKLDNSIEHERKFLSMGQNLGRRDFVTEACVSLLDLLFQRLELEFNPQPRAKIVEAALEISELGTKSADPNDAATLSLLHAISTPHYYFASQILDDPGKRERCRKLAVESPKSALSLAEGSADAFATGLAHHWMQNVKEALEGDIDGSITHSAKAVDYLAQTGDHYWVGFAAAYGTFVRGHWGTFVEVDPELREQKAAESERYASLAISHGEKIGNEFVLAWAHYGLGELYNASGMYSPLQKSDRISMFRRALEVNLRGLEFARLSSSISAIGNATHTLSKTYQFMAFNEDDSDKKKKLLDLALQFREESLTLVEKCTPHGDWDLGVLGNYNAMIRSEMARTESNKETKIQILKEAVVDAEKRIEHFKKSYPVTSEASSRFLSVYAWHSSNLGRTLKQLYELDRDPRILERLASAFRFSAGIAIRAERHSLAAEFHWDIARVYDSAGEFLAASSEFNKAAANYSRAIEEISALRDLYTDLSNYLTAWSHVEEARNHHESERFPEASFSYSNAAKHLRQSARLSPLSTHYMACSSLEEAEAHSRSEKVELTYDSFSKAASLFAQAKDEIEAQLAGAASMDEKEEFTKWLNVTRGRERYAIARATLEEGRILERKGEKLASGRKFAAAAAILEDLAVEEETETARREIESLALLCRAWQKMKQGEVENSQELYEEASELFLRAKRAAPTERLGLLSMGNASYCKALALGSRFRATHEVSLYSSGKRELESAADYYTAAGFEQASNWTRATERMFDALIYLSNAETQLDPEGKTKLYQLAEKNLDQAAKLYDQAGYSTKKEEALRHLKRAREEKELLLTPMEILTETPILSSASNIMSPALTRDKPLGLERFEHATVEANLIVKEKAVKVGDRVECEVEIVNAGRAPAALVKIERILPEGFTVEGSSEKYRLEDNHLNLKGRRLDPLKTEEVVLTLRPSKKGEFMLRPRILYLDEEGRYRYHEPEAVKLTVRELGISGWIKGPSK